MNLQHLAGLSVGHTHEHVRKQAHPPLTLHTWMIMCANVNFHLPVKLFCFQNAPVLNESLIVYGNNLLWSREEKEATIVCCWKMYQWHQTDGKRSLNQIKLCQWEILLTLLTRSTQHLIKMKAVVRTVNLNFSKRNSKVTWTEAIS